MKKTRSSAYDSQERARGHRRAPRQDCGRRQTRPWKPKEEERAQPQEEAYHRTSLTPQTDTSPLVISSHLCCAEIQKLQSSLPAAIS